MPVKIATRMPRHAAAARRPCVFQTEGIDLVAPVAKDPLTVEVDETLHTPQQRGRHLAVNERAVMDGDAGGDSGHIESVERIDRDLDASRVTGVAFGREEY